MCEFDMPQLYKLTPSRLTWLACALSILSLPGCGGGSGGASTPTTASGTDTSTPPEQVAGFTVPKKTTNSCEAAPTVPALPASTINVQSFGAIPNDGIDDTDAIQRALNSLQPGQWLVFPAGQYEHNRALHLRVADVTLWGKGATLNATNPADQALMLKADRDRVFGFTMTATTDYRRTEAWAARLVIYGGEVPAGYVSGSVLQDNKILPAVTVTGTPRSNSSSSAGILVYAGRDFTVAGNTVTRSLADGIHMTGGSRNGRVLNNTVSETGDDMIAMVTYMPTTWRTSALANSTWIANYLSTANVKQVLVANNTVSGQYWGRGISVVGGDSITIKNNAVSNTTYAAGIMVAREEGYNTTGVNNVVVTGNTVSHVQTTSPVYVPSGTNFTALNSTLSSGVTSGHGGIEVHSASLVGDVADVRLRPALTVTNVRIDKNTITDTRKDGIRVGTYSYANTIAGITLSDNQLTSVGLLAVTGQFLEGSLPDVNCSGNTLTGSAVSSSICTAPTAPTVTGATLDCAKF